jgi:hypothetical protein
VNWLSAGQVSHQAFHSGAQRPVGQRVVAFTGQPVAAGAARALLLLMPVRAMAWPPVVRGSVPARLLTCCAQ